MEGATAVVPAHTSNGVAAIDPSHSFSHATTLEGRVGGWPVAHLLEESFDSKEFVEKARRSMPLDDLLSELQAHLLNLRESLVDTINQVPLHIIHTTHTHNTHTHTQTHTHAHTHTSASGMVVPAPLDFRD
jgi:hypothetical protein